MGSWRSLWSCKLLLELKWKSLAELMEVISLSWQAHEGAVMSSWVSLWSCNLLLELTWKGFAELMEEDQFDTSRTPPHNSFTIENQL